MDQRAAGGGPRAARRRLNALPPARWNRIDAQIMRLKVALSAYAIGCLFRDVAADALRNEKGEDMFGSPIDRILHLTRSFGVLTVLSFVVAVPALVIVRVLEPDLVLPALSVLFFSIAGAAVLLAGATRARRNSEALNLWDVAGGLVMTGCAASVLGEPEQVTQLFEHLFERRKE
jgi:hypothetical protein